MKSFILVMTIVLFGFVCFAQAQPSAFDPQGPALCTTSDCSNPHAVPEPMTLFLVGSGLAGAALMRKKKSKQ